MIYLKRPITFIVFTNSKSMRLLYQVLKSRCHCHHKLSLSWRKQFLLESYPEVLYLKKLRFSFKVDSLVFIYLYKADLQLLASYLQIDTHGSQIDFYFKNEKYVILMIYTSARSVSMQKLNSIFKILVEFHIRRQ